MATSSSLAKTSLEAIPLLKGRKNYTSWSKQMESHLKASQAWLIITGKWIRPAEPSYVEAPLRPVDLIADQRARRQQEEEAQENDPDATPLPPYVPMLLRDAKEELVYIKAHIEQWNRWGKAERTAINDIISRISETCKEELGDLDDLQNIWDRLKALYVESTCGTWVKELNAVVKLIGGRKPGENPDEWMRKLITTGRNARDNLGELSWDILMAYGLTVGLGDDLTATTTETYRQSKWPPVDSIRTSISEEFQSKLNAGKGKPTAAARPDNEDPKLNLTTSSSSGRKRRRECQSSSPNKKQDQEGRKGWPMCPLCGKRHPIRKEGDCYRAKPETAPAGWVEKNKDKIEAFKKKKEKGQ